MPFTGYFGALLGGAISWRLVRSGHTPVAARKRACLISAVFLLATMAVPLLPNPALATAGMSFSFFWVCAWSINHYTLPIDIYGARPRGVRRRGAGVRVRRDAVHHFASAGGCHRTTTDSGRSCFAFALLPLAGYLLVHLFISDNSGADLASVQSQTPRMRLVLASHSGDLVAYAMLQLRLANRSNKQ